MGVVYKAEDTILERAVAIKFLPSGCEPSREAANRLKREARTLSALNHPNICTIYELGEYENQPYMVQELLVGSTLQEIIANRKLSPQFVLELAIQIADGLRAAHAIGLVHRDIKPANLFLTHENRAKILDFGVAGLSWSFSPVANDAATAVSRFGSTQPRAVFRTLNYVVGTLDYMSPEQVRGQTVMASSDIFSLGIVLYELLIRRHPFRKASIFETASSILTTPVECDLGLTTTAFDSVVLKMLAKNAADRYFNGGELLSDLRAIDLKSMASFRVSMAARALTPSVAILPFLNLSSDSDNDYFCNGLAEELIRSLTKVEGLLVAAWNSAFRFQGKDVDIREAGQRLGVSTVLEGSVRKSGNRLRVNAKLLDVKNGCSLWSERYEAEVHDVFAIQDQMADAIARELALRMGVASKPSVLPKSTPHPDAYNLYLKGRYFWNRRGPADIRKALHIFEQAVARDERFAAALAGIADCHIIAAIEGNARPKQVFPLARQSATDALAIEPEMPEALAALACIEGVFDWNWDAAEQRFQKAIELHPQCGAVHHWYASHLLLPLGRFAEARKQVEIACANDPLSLAIQIMAGLLAYYARDPGQAICEYQKALEMDSHFALAHYFLGQAYEQAGSFQESREALLRALELSPGSSEIEAALARAHARAGERSQAEEMIQYLREKATTQYVSPVLFAQMLLSIDRREDAIPELQRAFEMRATDLIWLRVRPVFDEVRSDNRVQQIESAIGLQWKSKN